MNPDAYPVVYDEENDILERVREVCPDGKYHIRVCLAYDEELFWKALPYAEEICDNLSQFLKTFESFKAEQKEKYLRKYYKRRWFRIRVYLDYAEEIGRLMIETVVCGGGEHSNHTEVYCHEIPGSWRHWMCGYVDGRFYDLWY